MWKIILIIFIILCVLFLPMLILNFFIARHIFVGHFTRHENSFNRTPSLDNDEEILMYKKGADLNKKLEKNIKEVEIENDGFKLKGEYVDLGFKKCVIIIPGRSEACKYSYYFSYPYVEAGYNLLLIDNRSHGLSDGKYTYLGLEEYKDILKWIKFAHDELKNDFIIAHGICIGSATALYALINEKCPSYFKGLIADGMYTNFPISFDNHIKERKKPVHFTSEFFFLIYKIKLHINPYYGPINCIDKLKKPILFLYSKEDLYSTPDKSQILFDKCGSDKKRIVWFDHGSHSHIRINNEEKYDSSIIKFLKDNF